MKGIAAMDAESCGLRSMPWRLSYRTSTLRPAGRPVDILHDFYIPALRRSVRYDRVAGYFRSTSLAAASWGFSAFVGRQERMRLIVGTDLDPDDVHAILQGDEARLTALLNAELDQTAAWPQGVRHGVELLAWMMAHGHLDVRVAFRVHTRRRHPSLRTAWRCPRRSCIRSMGGWRSRRTRHRPRSTGGHLADVV